MSCKCVPSLGVPSNMRYHMFGNGPFHQHAKNGPQHSNSHELWQAPDTRHTLAAETYTSRLQPATPGCIGMQLYYQYICKYIFYVWWYTVALGW